MTSELAWEFWPDQDVVVSADYGSGASKHHLRTADGWLFGLAYRQDFNLFRGNQAVGNDDLKSLLSRMAARDMAAFESFYPAMEGRCSDFSAQD